MFTDVLTGSGVVATIKTDTHSPVVVCPPGESIQCYQCNSHDDQRCADKNPPDEFRRECTTNEPQRAEFTLCRKIKQTIDFNVNGRKRNDGLCNPYFK